MMEDAQLRDFAKVKRILLCTGKIYYELEEARREIQQEEISIIRLEQLYPFPDKQLRALLSRYATNVELFWVQEEPANMGAALFVKDQLSDLPLHVVSRPASGVTAEGLTARHKINQAAIIRKSFSS